MKPLGVHIQSAVWLVLAALLQPSPALSEERPLKPRWKPEKDINRAYAPWCDRRLVLKLQDDSAGVAIEGKLRRGQGGLDISKVTSFLDKISGLRVEPMFGAPISLPLVPVEGSKNAVATTPLAQVRSAAETASGEEMADMSQFFFLHLPEGVSQRSVLEKLLRLDEVEDAYCAPVPVPPDAVGKWPPSE